MNVGVMGCSSFAQRAMLPALQQSASGQLKVVASRDAEKARKTAALFQCEAVSDYDALLASDVDAIYMPLPTGLHAEWVEKCLRAGKHVLVEKSFAMNVSEAVRLLELARDENLLIAENFHFPFHSQWDYIQRQLDGGVLGEVRLIRSTFGFPALPPDNFRWNKALGGGARLDAGAYGAKLAAVMLGANARLVGALNAGDGEHEVDCYGEAMFTNDRGLVVQLAYGFDYHYQCTLEVLGTKGKLTTNRIFTAPPSYAPVVCIERQGNYQEITLQPDNAYEKIWDWFAETLRTRDFEPVWQAVLQQAEFLDQMKGYL
ncbi:MAG: Gfo/Idh/MocA family oxidoreductase [Spartobacteria bacterium]|nr:Gfo/Idh/MocA family oxidoreductase [Spartobacteria bacterium]